MTIVVPFRGIIEVIGEHDTGKTIAMLQTVNNTKDITFIDDDVKGEGTVRQMIDQGMEFDEYIDLSKERAKIGKETPTADELLQEVVYPTVERIIKRKRKVIIWDTWRIVYQSARGHVERNQGKYKDVVTFRGTNEIIQGLISKVARAIELSQLNKLKSACDLLLISHHVKDNYVKNVVVGRIPESSITFAEVCNMRMWLRRNERSAVPVILFLKRPNLPQPGKTGLRFINIVPLKVTPDEHHESIWDAINDYIKDPIGNRMARPDETPTPEEFSVISGTLSDDQKSYLKMMVEFQRSMEEAAAETVSDDVSETPQKASRGPSESIPEGYPATPVELLQRAKSELGMGLIELQNAAEKTFAEISSNYDYKVWDKLKEVTTPKEKKKKK